MNINRLNYIIFLFLLASNITLTKEPLSIGFWNTENGLVNIDEQLENACLDEESTLFRFKEDMADTVVFRFADLLPVYDIYR